jgi:hypothetical protein
MADMTLVQLPSGTPAQANDLLYIYRNDVTGDYSVPASDFARTTADNTLTGNLTVGADDTATVTLKLQGNGAGDAYGYPAMLTLEAKDGTPWHLVLRTVADGPNTEGLMYMSAGMFNFYVPDGVGSVVCPLTLSKDYTQTYVPLIIGSVSEYADNAAALLAGLAVGVVYRTGDILKVVH